MLHAAEWRCSVSQSSLPRAGCSRSDTMGSLAWLSLITAVSAQRTLILTNKALEAVEAAKDLARQRRHALLEPHHVATILFSDPNTFSSRVLKSAGGDAALLHADLRKELRRLPRGDNDNTPQSAILEVRSRRPVV